MYNYNNFNNMVIFNEYMNDLARCEGKNGVAMEDDESGIFSIALYKIDTSKKYRMAIQMDPEMEEVTLEWKMIINLK